MIIPCIDLMGGKAVQLVRGREKALEREDAFAQLEQFAGFAEIQLIDLDAAMSTGSNDELVRGLCARATCRVGGGVRTPARALQLMEAGATMVIVGTAAFSESGVNTAFLEAVGATIGPGRIIVALDSRNGRIVIKGWREETALTAEQVVRQLEPYCGEFLCTFVDTEGTMTGTDLGWFRRLREATPLPITAAGGIASMEEVRALDELGIHIALGMAIYTGRLDLDELRAFQPRTRT